MVLKIQVLGVNRAASKESCLKASEQLLAAVPDVGYSAELLLSRALVLETASNVLMDYTARRAYDRAPLIEVPYHDLPGKRCSLSLLCRHVDSACFDATELLK